MKKKIIDRLIHFLIIPCLLMLVNTLISPVAYSDSFIMAFGQDPNTNPQYMFYLEFYTEAFAKLDLDFKYVLYPSIRATQMANSGKVDGEPQRILAYEEKNPNLVRVKEPIFTNRTLAFAIDKSIKFDNLQSLKDTMLKVDYLRGSVWSKKNLEATVPKENLSIVDDSYQGFLKLINKRTDIFVVLEASGLKTLYSNELFSNSAIFPLGQVGSNQSYPYLHYSHSDLALKLAKVIKEMKESGRYKELLLKNMPYMLN